MTVFLLYVILLMLFFIVLELHYVADSIDRIYRLLSEGHDDRS